MKLSKRDIAGLGIRILSCLPALSVIWSVDPFLSRVDKRPEEEQSTSNVLENEYNMATLM